MTYSSPARPTLALLVLAAIAGCGGSASTTTATVPTPAPTTTSTTTTTTSTTRPSAGGLPSGVTTAMVAMGDSIFHARSCVRCHGADAKGRQNGPDLTTATHLQVNGSYEDFIRVITEGVPADKIKDKSHTLPMRARGGQPPPLTDDEIKAVAAYVFTLSHK